MFLESREDLNEVLERKPDLESFEGNSDVRFLLVVCRWLVVEVVVVVEKFSKSFSQDELSERKPNNERFKILSV